MTHRALGLLALALLASTACRPSGPGFPDSFFDDDDDDGPETTLDCPEVGSLPFTPGSSSWADSANEDAAAELLRLKHEPADILGNPDAGFFFTDSPTESDILTGAREVHGVMARAAIEEGLASEPIVGETVEIWSYSDADGWISEGEDVTDAEGGYSLDMGSGALGAEFALHYAVLGAEPSCAAHYTYLMEAGRQVVFTDIDGTLTLSDEELFAQISDGDHDPALMGNSDLLVQTWADKGYQVVYLTARPHIFRSETRAWLDRHNYPPGPLISANSLVFGDSARTYKRTWVNRATDLFGWDVVAAYGNAGSDIDAYEDAGIPKEVTFIVGENAGASGTMPIANNDYAAHIQEYVMNQPDATAP